MPRAEPVTSAVSMFREVMIDRSEGDAAGDLEALPGDPLVAGAREGRDRVADVVGDGVAPERRERRDHLLDGLVVAEQPVAEVGRDRPRSDRVDSDAASPEVVGEVAGEDL